MQLIAAVQYLLPLFLFVCLFLLKLICFPNECVHIYLDICTEDKQYLHIFFTDSIFCLLIQIIEFVIMTIYISVLILFVVTFVPLTIKALYYFASLFVSLFQPHQFICLLLMIECSEAYWFARVHLFASWYNYPWFCKMCLRGWVRCLGHTCFSWKKMSIIDFATHVTEGCVVETYVFFPDFFPGYLADTESSSPVYNHKCKSRSGTQGTCLFVVQTKAPNIMCYRLRFCLFVMLISTVTIS